MLRSSSRLPAPAVMFKSRHATVHSYNSILTGYARSSLFSIAVLVRTEIIHVSVSPGNVIRRVSATPTTGGFILPGTTGNISVGKSRRASVLAEKKKVALTDTAGNGFPPIGGWNPSAK